MYNKTSIKITCTLAVIAILTVMSYSIQQSYAQGNNLQNAVLSVHNQERAQVNVPSLSWSNSLAADAQTYANYLTTLGITPTGIAAHDPNVFKKGQNENLAWGTKGAYTPTELMNLWAEEKRDYVTGTPVPESGGPKVGHYTQMVWKDTTEVGCAIASSDITDFLVCRYSPPGNWIGEVPY